METLGVGLVVPALALLTKSDLARNYPVFAPALRYLGDPDPKTLVVGGMLLLVSVYIVKAVFLGWLTWRQARFAFGVQEHLSHRLFTVYLRQPYTFHLQRNSAQLIRNVNEVGPFVAGGIMPAMVFATESLVLVGVCALLLIVEPVGALVVIGVLGVASWGFYGLTRKRITRWGEARLFHEGLRLQHLQQGLSGAKDVKLLGREADFLQRFGSHNTSAARIYRLDSTLRSLPRLWVEVLAVVGLFVLLLSMLAQNKPGDAMLPTLGMFAAAAFRIMPSVTRLMGAVQSLRFGVPSIDLLHGEIHLPDTAAPPAARSVVHFTRSLEVRNVIFTYPGAERPSLADVSIKVKKGETVGIIGTTGSGKSTLVDVFLGLLPGDVGEVLVDGENIRLNMREWQDQIGYVAQAIYLTDDSLRRNVAFGLPDNEIDDAAVRRAIRAAQLDEFVNGQAKGLNTIVGERGVRLSGGQRQRIGIARALYHDPPVLVLDEASSALDLVTERGLMAAVCELHGQKTILIVAHRLSTLEHCDRIYRLSAGRVVEVGNPDNMIASGVRDFHAFSPVAVNQRSDQ